MTPEDRIRAGNAVLVFDAPNVPVKKLFTLAKNAKTYINDLRVVVPVTAHTEHLIHLRRTIGSNPTQSYDATIVRKALEDVGVEIILLDLEAAESIAERLCQWFPTQDAWLDAKWRRLHGDTPRSARKPPATIDWYTAAMCPPGGIVVTDDTGVEFQGCDILRSPALEVVLREIAAAAAGGAQTPKATA